MAEARLARRTAWHTVVATVCACLLLATAAAAAEPATLTWKIDGVARRALVYAPAARGDAAPLVFVFHGAGDTADNFSGVNLHGAWPDAVIVYMDGLARGPGQGGVFQTTDPTTANRDLRLFDTALADLRTRFKIDDTRIYATGFSNGARFVYLLWATRPDLFAAFAPVAGMLAPGLTLRQPKPVLHIGGREDHQYEFTLQLASIELAKQTDHAGAGKPCGDNCTVYQGTGGTTVMTLLHGGGHVYPPGASERIVAFFREQKRRSSP